jgi:hypothetical protein
MPATSEAKQKKKGALSCMDAKNSRSHGEVFQAVTNKENGGTRYEL